MRDRLIGKLANLSISRPGQVLLAALIITIIAAILSGNLGMTMRWSDMLPQHDRRTIEFDRIIKEFYGASSIVVLVQGEENRIKEFAETLAPRVLGLISVPGNDKIEPTEYVRRVDYKQEVEFMREHGFMLMKEDDLKNMKAVFQDPDLIPLLRNINDSFEKEYIQPEESMSTREEEDGALIFLNGIDTWLQTLYTSFQGAELPDESVEAAVDKFLLGEPYLLSYDRRALILNLLPTFPMTDLEKVVNGTDAVQAILDETLTEFPDVQAGLTGFIPLGRDETVYGTQGLEVSMLLAMVAIGALLFLTLRMWVAPLLAMANLVIGLIWAAGVVALVVDELNIITMMFMVILAGLGIDFSIHIISGFTENLALGKPVDESMRKGMLNSGKGVLTGAITTAAAFLALTIGESRAMNELGWVTGLGLLAVCVSSFTTLPAMLILRERRKERRYLKRGITPVAESRDISFTWLGRLGDFLTQRWAFTLIAAIILTGLFAWSATDIKFDYNYMNMEPEGIPSVTLQDTVVAKFDLSMDFAYLIAGSVDESRMLKEEAKDLNSVAAVEDISLYLPSLEQQEQRIPHINEIHETMANARTARIGTNDLDKLMAELERIEMNIIEMQSLAYIGGQDKVYKRTAEIAGLEGDETIFTRIKAVLEENPEGALKGANTFQNQYAEYFQSSVLSMTNTAPLTLEMLPERIVERYANRDRNMFLVTVLPSDNIWTDFTFLEEFAGDVESVSESATGMPPVFRALIEVIGRDGRNAALLTLIVVFVLLSMDFRNLGYALMAMLPLAAGVAWMMGFMAATGMMMTVVNVMAIPLILGIGIDDGVHVMHRWLREGPGSTRLVYASTGKAILLTSLTTMIAFFSMVFSVYRGYASLGWALVVGVGACFLTSVLILPGIIGFIERKRSK